MMAAMLAGLVAPFVVGLVAFGLRVAIHAGRRPGGVDTWYFLAYADAFRRRPSLDVRLPQYLLQDERQSYPPLFPSLLALLPSRWLRRWFWTIAPALDCVHLLLLYAVTWRLTGHASVATLAAGAYAVTPQLVSDTRSLSPRPFALLLNSTAMLLLLGYAHGDRRIGQAVAATLAAALLYLTSAAVAAAYGVTCAALAMIFQDPRYVFVAGAGLVLAIVVSGGHMLRVVRNYAFAIEYWRRNRHLYGRHPIHGSPILGRAPAAAPPPAAHPGFFGESTARQLLRLLGENPFLLWLPFAPRPADFWSRHFYWWAVILAAFSVVATVLPPLRAFGPGRSYVKAAIFPTAYLLATVTLGPTPGSGVSGLVGVACLVASLGAIAFFYAYTRRRRTEHTATVPEALRDAAQVLAGLPPGAVFVLPYMYADYMTYWSGQPVVWGGHCGDHRKFEWITPVVSRPLDEIFRDVDVRYVLIDRAYVTFSDLAFEKDVPTWQRGEFALHTIPPRCAK
jgi:hypothetical protein